MLPQIKKGFTLIELLVVITIIGILATGATAVYTSQIQKARDTTRINDIKALQGSIEQFYQDGGAYPKTTSTDFSSGGVLKYMAKLPKDPKNGQTCAKVNETINPDCNYAYAVEADDNQIAEGSYEISTAFENKGNIDAKATNDKLGGAKYDNDRLEIGTPKTAGIDTKVEADADACKDKIGLFKVVTGGKCTATVADSTSTNILIIAGN